MATLYVKVAGGNWSAATTWSNTGSGGVDNSGPPTAADNVILELLSGSVTIDAASVCRSLDATSGTGSYTGTLTHNAFTLTIGDATAGPSNVALKFGVGMTYTLANVITSAISFISTSVTQQTIDYGGKTVGNITVNSASNGNYAFTSAVIMDTTATFTSTAGDVHMDGISDNLGLHHFLGHFIASSSTVRTINLGSSLMELLSIGTTWSISSSANLTFLALSSEVAFTGLTPVSTDFSNSFGSKAYGTVRYEGPGSGGLANGSTYINFVLKGTYRPDGGMSFFGVSAGNTIRVSGSITIYGDSAANPCFFYGSNNSVPGTIDVTGATVDFRYVTIQDTIFITGGENLDLSGIIGGSGDAGNNSISGGGTLTFTSPKTTHWIGNGGNLNDVSKWSNGLPLPQDSAIFDKAFTGSPTISMNVLMMLGNADFSASTGTVTLSADLPTTGLCMPFTGRSGMILASTSTNQLYLESRRTTDTFTFNGMSYNAATTISAGHGTITFMDSGTVGGSNLISHRSGRIVIPAGITVSMNSYISTASETFSLRKASVDIYGIWSLFGTSTVFSLNNATNTTAITGFGSGFMNISNTSASSKTFAGKGGTYPALRIGGGGAGAVIFTGANTFARIYTNGAGTKNITLPGSTTTTILSGQGLGNGINIITFTASAGSATISKTGGPLSWDYVNLTNIPSTGGATFYAGTHSTDGGGNTGWIFTAPPFNPASVAGNRRQVSIGIGLGIS